MRWEKFQYIYHTCRHIAYKLLEYTSGKYMQNGVRISTRTFNIKIVNFMTLWSGLYARFGFYCQLMFSSPELKAQVSFSDQLSSVVCPSFHLSVIFSHVYLLLQNHWATFNQNWHKVSLGEGDSKGHALPKGEIIGK